MRLKSCSLMVNSDLEIYQRKFSRFWKGGGGWILRRLLLGIMAQIKLWYIPLDVVVLHPVPASKGKI